MFTNLVNYGAPPCTVCQILWFVLYTQPGDVYLDLPFDEKQKPCSSLDTADNSTVPGHDLSASAYLYIYIMNYDVSCIYIYVHACICYMLSH